MNKGVASLIASIVLVAVGDAVPVFAQAVVTEAAPRRNVEPSASPAQLPPDTDTHQCFLKGATCPGSFYGEVTIFGCHGPTAGTYAEISRFHGVEGQYLTADVVAAFPPVVLLADSAGNLLTADTSPKQISSTITDYRLRYTGEYRIAVFGQRAGDVGRYGLTLKCSTTPSSTTPPPPTSCTDSGVLSIGSTVTSQLTASTGSACLGGGNYYTARYALVAQAGVPVKITYTPTYAPYLLVGTATDSRGIYAQNLTAAPAEVTYLPESSGTHFVYLSSYAERATGSYTIHVEAAPLDPCKRRSVTH